MGREWVWGREMDWGVKWVWEESENKTVYPPVSLRSLGGYKNESTCARVIMRHNMRAHV